jgi:ABC-2 type transport system permease protein
MQNNTGFANTARRACRIAYLNGFLFLKRNPASGALNAATPLSLLFVLFVISGGDYVHLAVIGSMVVAIISAGLSLGEDAVFYRIEHRLQDIIVSSPVPSLAYMGGLALSQLLFNMPSLVILASLVIILGGMPLVYIPLFAAMMLLLWAAMSSIGFFVASRITHQRTTYQVISAINIGVLASPVYYSMDIVPQQLHILAYLVPTTHASLLLQYMTGLPTPAEWSPALGFVAMFAAMAVFVLLVTRKAVWGED